jgi:hypothetical protein
VNYDNYEDFSVELAIDLINDYGSHPRVVAGRGDDPLPPLEAFLRDHHMDARGVEAGAEQAARQLADRLHVVFTADESAHAVAVVNEVLAESGALPQISGHDDEDWHLHYYPAGIGPLDRLAVTAAMGLSAVLCTGGVRRLGRCDGSECRDVYVDTSRNNRRRFCSDGCANRAHVAAHRARRRKQPS